MNKPQTTSTPIILTHGWAYTPSFFEPWLKNNPENHHTQRILALNQGYFDPSTHPHWQEWHTSTQTWLPTEAPAPNTPCIGIGHSLGLSKLLHMPLTWKTLISINGFTQFPKNLALRQMIRKAPTTLPNIITGFQERCGATMPFPQTPNQSALLADLESLLTLDCSTALQQHAEHGTHIIHIATQQDSIIPAPHSTACFNHLSPPTVQLHLQDGTHSDIHTTPTRYTWLFEHIQRSTPF